MIVLLPVRFPLRMPMLIFAPHGFIGNIVRLFANRGIRLALGAHHSAVVIVAAEGFPQLRGERLGMLTANVNADIFHGVNILWTNFGTDSLKLSDTFIAHGSQLFTLLGQLCEVLLNDFQPLFNIVRFTVAMAVQRSEQHRLLIAQFFDFFRQCCNLSGKLVQTDRMQEAAGFLLGQHILAFGRFNLNLLFYCVNIS